MILSISEIKFAVRGLIKKPAFTAIAILTLGNFQCCERGVVTAAPD
jgi:hypothetical protein